MKYILNNYLESLRSMNQSLGSYHLLNGYQNDDRIHHLSVGNQKLKKEHLENLLIHLNHLLLHLESQFLHRPRLENQMEQYNQGYAILNESLNGFLYGQQMMGDCLVLVEQMMECSLAAMLDLVLLG